MAKKWVGGLIGLEVLVFGLLEGSMVTLGLLVAPVVFKTITSRDLAGRVFGNILNVWVWPGLVCGLILLATSLLTLLKFKPFSRWLLARTVVLVIMTGLIGGFGLVLNRIDTIQNALTQPIENYPADTNPRLEFDTLHKLSTNLLSAALILGLVWLVFSVIVLVRWRAVGLIERTKEVSRAEQAVPQVV